MVTRCRLPRRCLIICFRVCGQTLQTPQWVVSSTRSRCFASARCVFLFGPLNLAPQSWQTSQP